tara:strand:+ start:1549 stop:2307 length:759 start_codon:yes stop_codon:yes gene_type:complete
MRQATTQLGFSLVELMIAMVLGLLLLAGVVNVQISSKETFQTSDDLSRVQENGRFALDILASDIRMAGYRPPENGNTPHYFLTDACDEFNPCTSDGGGNDSDRIAVQYDPDSNSDCFGNAVGDTDLVVNVYSITFADNVNSLSCRSWNASTGGWVSAARPLIAGVDNMQALYGIKNSLGTSVTRYVSADRVTDWTQVQSVRIAVLVARGTQFGQSEARARNYVLLDSPTLTFNDRHNRRVFTTTVTLNNAFI